MVVNLACVPIVWFLYPETAGRALEDMDALFGSVKLPARAAASGQGGNGVPLGGGEPEYQDGETPSERDSREEEARLLG